MRRALVLLAPVLLVLMVGIVLAGCGGGPPLAAPYENPGGAVIRVPEEQPTIQAGVDAAGDGDVVLVAPGFYFEKVQVIGKRLTVASWFLASGDPEHRDKTVISGRGAAFEVKAGREASGDLRVVGFTLRNAKFGVVSHDSEARVEDNRIYSNANDGIVGFNSRLTVLRNEIRDQREGAGILVNGATNLLVEDNRIDHNLNGIQAILHHYEGETVELIVRGNRVTRSRSGGVVLAGFEEPSDRVVRIERNVFARSQGVAVGCQNIRGKRPPTDGAALPTPVFVAQNTFVENGFGLIGGDNVVALNNLFVETSGVAMMRLRERSVAERNGFWRNVRDTEDVPRSRLLRPADPLLDDDFRLGSGSPAIDAGLATYSRDGVTVLPVGQYAGEAPDLGAFER